MRIIKALAAAGLGITAIVMGTAAQAQDHNDNGRPGYHREYRDARYDSHRRYVWRAGHRHCWTEWRHHHRVRVCR
jgi:hypothetical protein